MVFYIVPANVARTEHGSHVADTTIGNSDLKAVGVTNEPVHHEATVAAPNDSQALLIDIPSLEHLINTLQNIDRRLFAPGVAYSISKVVAITNATTWVGIKDDIALRNEKLHFVEEAIPVLSMWTTMNFNDERVLSGWIEVVRLHNPAINWPAVSA